MPIYEYQCPLCGHSFEVKQSFREEAVAFCPRCRGRAHRRFHPVPVIFKGPGFYTTDSRKLTEPEKKETEEK